MMRATFTRVAILTTASICVAGCHDPTAEFCAIAETSSEGRGQEEVAAYYEQLEAAAPEEILEAVTTLRDGWNTVSMPFAALGGSNREVDPSEISRPEEVSDAARTVTAFVREHCDAQNDETGVYLIFPEAGY